MIFVNFKTYKQGTGSEAVSLAKSLEKVAEEEEIKVIPVVQAGDVQEIVRSVKIEVWAQHVDPIEFGAHTGSIISEAILEDGALGTFLNHSEHKFESFDDLSKANSKALEVGLKTLIFAADINELKKVVELKPTYVSYEPPELVGSKTTSVAESKPEIISEAVQVARDSSLPLVVGAGIKSEEDVRKSIELGAVGVAVASSIVTAENPIKSLEKLVKGFK